MKEWFHVDLELRGGSLQDRITVYEGQDLDMVVKDYCNSKGLNPVVETIIRELMTEKSKCTKNNGGYSTSRARSRELRYPLGETRDFNNKHPGVNSFIFNDKANIQKDSKVPYFQKPSHQFSILNKEPNRTYQPSNSPAIFRREPTNPNSAARTPQDLDNENLFFRVTPNNELQDSPQPLELSSKPEAYPSALFSPPRSKRHGSRVSFVLDSKREISQRMSTAEKESLRMARLRDSIAAGDRLYQAGIRQFVKRDHQVHSKEAAERLCSKLERRVPAIDPLSRRIADAKIAQTGETGQNVFKRLVTEGNKWLGQREDKAYNHKRQVTDRTHYQPEICKISEKLSTSRRQRSTSTSKNPQKSAFDRLYTNEKADFYTERIVPSKEKDSKPIPTGSYKNFISRMNEDLKQREQKKSPAPTKPQVSPTQRARSKEAKDTTDQLYNSAFERRDKKKEAEDDNLKKIKEIASMSKITKKSEEIIEAIIKSRVEVMFTGFDKDKDGLISFENIKVQFDGDMHLPARFKKLVSPFMNLIVEKKMTLDSMAFEYSLRKFVKKLTIDEKRAVLCLDYEGKNAFLNMVKKITQDEEATSNDQRDKSLAAGVSLIFEEAPAKDPWGIESPGLNKMKNNMEAIDKISLVGNQKGYRNNSKPSPDTLSRLVSNDSSFFSKLK